MGMTAASRDGHMSVFIENDYTSMQTKIWLIQIRGNEQFLIGYNGSELVEQKLEECELISTKNNIPLLQLPYFLADNFLKVFANAVNGVKFTPEDKGFVSGKLEATEKHLEDLRKMFDKFVDKL